MRGSRVLPPTYLLVALLLQVGLHFAMPLMQLVAMPWNLLGIVPVICGIALNLSADSALKKARTTVKPFQESIALVRTGVYGLSRHPMYLGYVLLLLGVAVMLGSLTPFFVVPIFTAVMEIVFIRAEERMLQQSFTEAWADYSRRVRRWI